LHQVRKPWASEAEKLPSPHGHSRQSGNGTSAGCLYHNQREKYNPAEAATQRIRRRAEGVAQVGESSPSICEVLGSILPQYHQRKKKFKLLEGAFSQKSITKHLLHIKAVD
jgi:hypothetical protein